MSQHADEALDHDPLLEFANEPESAPAIETDDPASVQAAANVEVAAPPPSPLQSNESLDRLNARLDGLEQRIDSSALQFATLKAELTTLVGAMDDFRKRDIRRAAMHARPNPPRAEVRHWPSVAFAILGMTIGMAMGITGWMFWSRDSVTVVQAMPAPVGVEAPIEPEAPPQPSIVLASANPAPAPVRTAAAGDEDQARPITAYVGTLSIDAEPGGEVFIDRRRAGRTPLRVASLKAGSHLVWIERDGHRRWTRVVQVLSDRVSRVSAQLEPLASR